MMRFDDQHNPLVVEIRQEMASAYFAACTKMVDSLEALREFDRGAAASNLDERRIARRTELLEEAAERVYFLIVQREAMKLSWSDQFFEDYGISAEVKARLGVRRALNKAQCPMTRE